MSTRALPLLWLWLGASLLLAAVVAPAAFAVLPTRALAGALVGRILPVLFWSGAIVGAVALASFDGWRRIAAIVIIAASLGAQLGVAPRIARARQSLGVAIEDVPVDDPRRVAFGRLHGISVLLLGLGMLGAAAIAVGDLMRPGVSLPSNERAPVTLPSSR